MYGGKGANLASFQNIRNVMIPKTFLISTEDIQTFLTSDDQDQIRALLEEMNEQSSNRFVKETVRQIQVLIDSLAIPKRISEAIERRTKEFSKYAVRSSSVLEDGAIHSFAGQSESYLSVRKSEIGERIRDCLKSLYTERIIHYCIERKINVMDLRMAVVVQEMIDSDISGIMFFSPGNDKQPQFLLIEAVRGEGEKLASGLETPERYIFRGDSDVCFETTDPDHILLQPHELREIRKLAHLAFSFKRYALDIEFTIESGSLYLLQCRPLTSTCPTDDTLNIKESEGPEYLKGFGASPGIASGPVFYCTDEPIEGGILYGRMTTPDMIPMIRKASGIVTQRGGYTCHAAIVSRELGKPCIVGVGKKVRLEQNQIVTIDGQKGVVLLGDHSGLLQSVRKEDHELQNVKTRTGIMLNVSVPDVAKNARALNSNGIGLLRMEFLYADALKKHPLAMSEQERDRAITSLSENLSKICKEFAPLRVMIRMCDFKTNEYRQMPEGEVHEPIEENPMIGWRGAMRLLSRRNRGAVSIEMEVLRRLSELHDNFDIMIPFVRSAEELLSLRRRFQGIGISLRQHRLICLVETPSVAYDIENILRYCDGVSIGSNDLFQLFTGIDRDNDSFTEEYLEQNKLTPGVLNPFLKMLSRIIRTCHRENKSVGICGQSTSFDSSLIRYLVHEKIDYVSGPPNAFFFIKKHVVEFENDQRTNHSE
jgi:pyruvate,water dikinase